MRLFEQVKVQLILDWGVSSFICEKGNNFCDIPRLLLFDDTML